jgi:site-specific recombinase XerD
MLLSQAVEPYLSYCRVDKLNSPQTVAKVADCFRVWITPFVGDLELEQLSITDVLRIKGALVDQNRSPARQYGVIMALKSFLKFCIQILKVKTLDPAEVKLPDRGKPHVLTLSKEEIDQLLTNVPHQIFTGARLRALIELLLPPVCGFRKLFP